MEFLHALESWKHTIISQPPPLYIYQLILFRYKLCGIRLVTSAQGDYMDFVHGVAKDFIG